MFVISEWTLRSQVMLSLRKEVDYRYRLLVELSSLKIPKFIMYLGIIY